MEGRLARCMPHQRRTGVVRAAAIAAAALFSLLAIRTAIKVRCGAAAAPVVLFFVGCALWLRRRIHVAAAGKLQLSADKVHRPSLAVRRWRSQLMPHCSKTVLFSPRVSCMPVPNLLELPEERKAEIWWQPDDFADFLRVRVEIGRAYKAAAMSLGVEVMNVSSVGPNAKEGYKAMIEVDPALTDESRRGLGLGRKRQRAKNRDAYIAAVIKEQRRQHDLRILDDEALSHVAQRVSQKDRDYAHFLAQMYFERDGACESLEAHNSAQPQQTTSSSSNSGNVNVRTSEFTKQKPGQMTNDEVAQAGETSSPLTNRMFSEELVDTSSALDELGQQASPRGNSAVAAKGFGLSRDKLQEVGLSVTGHALSKYQRLRTLPRENSFGSEDGSEISESEFTGGETEIEELGEIPTQQAGTSTWTRTGVVANDS